MPDPFPPENRETQLVRKIRNIAVRIKSPQTPQRERVRAEEALRKAEADLQELRTANKA